MCRASRKSWRRWINIAFVVGFIVPLFSGFVAMVLFSAREETTFIKVVLTIPYVLCPFLLLGDSVHTNWWLASPFLNGALYALIAYLGLRIRGA
jgi:hypothetical protein